MLLYGTHVPRKQNSSRTFWKAFSGQDARNAARPPRFALLRALQCQAGSAGRACGGAHHVGALSTANGQHKQQQAAVQAGVPRRKLRMCCGAQGTRAAVAPHAKDSVGAGSQTSMKSATSAMMMLAPTKSSSCWKFSPRLVNSALVFVKMPIPTCRHTPHSLPARASQRTNRATLSAQAPASLLHVALLEEH